MSLEKRIPCRIKACRMAVAAESLASMNEAQVMAACGEEGIRRMVTAFYKRVRQDDLIGPMYPDGDWEAAEERLAGFLIFRLGGSTRYIETRGHPRLRMRHVPFSIGVAERDRWLELMAAAMDETAVPDEARAFLVPFFEMVADSMRNRPEA
jgi:hemoglobin